MVIQSERPLNIDTDTFTTYSDAVQAAALTTTRLAATSLPADLSFHRSIDPALARDVDAFSDRILTLASKLVYTASGKTSRIREEEDVVDEFVRNIVDPMEGMLESTDGALDVFLGKRKDPAIPIPAVPVDPHQRKPKKQPFRGRLDPALTHASYIPKPQLSFKYSSSNTDESPYIPATLIPHKWCAKVPLGYVFHEEKSDRHIEDAHEDDDEDERRKRMLHPYYFELTHPSYPDHVFSPPAEPSLPPSLESSSSGTSSNPQPLTFVSTPKAFLSMANAVSSATELAVDLEHHSYRSYKGFLALMQISTRQADFVVDLLAPDVREGLRQAKDKNFGESEEARIASEAGAIIARVFADPSVIKVFHGAESDIVWLQQDFNIFVVGLFDTFHASKLLEFPKHSLAHLLEVYCDFIPDKRYQLADWRIRPLPAEMTTYARSDTHFLLYIYDMIRLSLIERLSTVPATSDEALSFEDTKQTRRCRDLIDAVLTRSSRTALRLYENEVYDEEGGTGSSGWDTLARKWNKIVLVGSPSQVRRTEVQGSQTAVYKAVHRWREDVAREEDESTRYVLPTHHLFLIAERAPTTVPDLLSLFGGPGGVNGSVPPTLKRRTGELVTVMKSLLESTKSTSGPQEMAEDRHEGARMVSATVEELEVTSSATPSSPAPKQTNESRLWAVASLSTSVSTMSISRSSLFGGGVTGDHAQEEGVAPPPLFGGEGSYSAIGSVLFGGALAETIVAPSSCTTKSTLTHVPVSDDSAERFKTLMEKIHKTLVIAPVVSVPPATPSTQTQASEIFLSGVPMEVGMDQSNSVMPETSDLASSGPAGQVEIPFIPSHQRQTLSNPQNHELKDDTIVIVGQAGARQRKRKRDKARGTLSTSQSRSGPRSGNADTSISTGDHDWEVEEFDYSNVPNLLDNDNKLGNARGLHEEDERSKKRQRHGKGMLQSPSHQHSKKNANVIVTLLARNLPRLLSGTGRYAIQVFAPGAMDDEVLANLSLFIPH